MVKITATVATLKAVALQHNDKTAADKKLVLPNMIMRFMSFYKSLTVEQLAALNGYSYNNDMMSKIEFNEFLVADEFTFDFNNILQNEAIMALVFDVERVIHPDYKHLAKYVTYNPNMYKRYVRAFVNKYYIEPINILTALFRVPAVRKFKLSDDIILYKGLQQCFIADKKVGDTVIFKNFVSTSLSRNIALSRYASKMIWRSKAAISGTGGRVRTSITREMGCMCELSGLGGLQYIFVPGELDGWRETGDELEKRITAHFLKGSKHSYFIALNEYEVILQRNVVFEITAITETALNSGNPTSTATKKLDAISYKEYKQNKQNMDEVIAMGDRSHPKKPIKSSSSSKQVVKVYHLKLVKQLPVRLVPHWHVPSDLKLVL
jgi:hypothetical protein